LFPEYRRCHGVRRSDQHGGERAGGVLARPDEVLGFRHPRDWYFSNLSNPRHPPVHSAVPNRAQSRVAELVLEPRLGLPAIDGAVRHLDQDRYFQSDPKELDEAALIDGAGHLQMLWKIFIPVALPGIIAATIFAFTVSWAAFVYPLAFLYS